MKVIINGFEEDVAPGSTIDSLIDSFEVRHHSLIVELNGRFVHPEEYARRQVDSGDKVEMIHPAFGG